MQLFVHTQELHILEATRQETVAQIKATPGQCGIKALTTLEVTGHTLGGKVHGSLAHAGKERGQTPKWWKQYNRCFVNVMPIFGKKKGPNANSYIGPCNPSFPQ
ncbi:unnamed protein product [Nyctereutes procyonoides]|uniref:(raccoon dog) hypothetical protein n=1 Tax=Nyctereutes procyonoides TaxID=34880 RepID=A0A811YHM5_NYCPR|nr:unnamed protein product [Nyctereutes procyonoides]